MDARIVSLSASTSRISHDDSDVAALIREHQSLVNSIARRVHYTHNASVDLEDLTQIGRVGLIEAVNNFVDRGEATFATYARMRIHGAMIDHLRHYAFISRRGNQLRRQFGRTIDHLRGITGRTPSDAEMAEHLNLKLESYRMLLDSARAPSFVPLESLYSDQDEAFADDRADAFEKVDRRLLAERIGEAIGELPVRQALVLQLYFFEELGLDEIGSMMDVGAARVCQIKKAALAKLGAKLTALQLTA